MSGSRLRLLGGFALEHDDDRVDVPLGMQRLLGFLALRGTSRRCVVAGNLWPDVTEPHALASLRTSAWRMNRMLPGLLVADGAALAMTSEVVVDSREQEAIATRLLRDHVEAAVVEAGAAWLLAGELLPGWYDDWVVFERERLSQLRLHALERGATALTLAERLDLALQLALEAVRTEPLRETANIVLMSVYLAEGNVSDAVRQYDRFRGRLDDELGLEPSEHMGALLPALTRV